MKHNNENDYKLICGVLQKELNFKNISLLDKQNQIINNEYPFIDIILNKESIMIFVELPGLKLEDFVVAQYEDLVIIEGKFNKIDDKNIIRYFQIERRYNFFKRLIKLPFNNMTNTKAKLKDGVLVLEFKIYMSED